MKNYIYITFILISLSLHGLNAQDVSLTNANMISPAQGQEYGKACFTMIAEEGVSVTSIPVALEISMSKVEFDATDITGFNSNHFSWSVDGFVGNVIRGTLISDIPDVDNGGGGAQICIPVKRSDNDYSDNRNGYAVNIVPGSLDQGGNSASDYTSRFGFSNASNATNSNKNQAFAKNLEIANSLNESMLETTVTVYPNPSTDLVRIQAEVEGGNHSINVFDANGRAMIRSKAFNGNETLRVQNWTPGMYVMEIQNNNTGDKSTKQIMVAR